MFFCLEFQWNQQIPEPICQKVPIKPGDEMAYHPYMKVFTSFGTHHTERHATQHPYA